VVIQFCILIDLRRLLKFLARVSPLDYLLSYIAALSTPLCLHSAQIIHNLFELQTCWFAHLQSILLEYSELYVFGVIGEARYITIVACTIVRWVGFVILFHLEPSRFWLCILYTC